MRIDENLDPEFRQVFEFQSSLPGPTGLVVEVKDYDMVGKDDEIGRTKIDLEDRWFGAEWAKLEPKPIERRTLRQVGSRMARGKLVLWVDIMTKAEASRSPKVDISLPPPADFELRMVVYQARKMVALDAMTNANDLFFSCSLTTMAEDANAAEERTQETDVHWRARSVGSFNWRMCWDVALPQHEHSPARLSIKAFDKDPTTFSSDLVGFTELNLTRSMFDKGLRKWRQLQRRKEEIKAMDAAALRAEIEKLAGRVDLPADAAGSREKLATILTDLSVGEAGTVVRFPEKHGQEMGPDGVVRDGAGSRLDALRSRLQGTGEAPRLWLPLRHPSTGDACRGTASLIPFETSAGCLLMAVCFCLCR